MKDMRQSGVTTLNLIFFCLLFAFSSVWAQGEPIIFSIVGDIPYGSGEIPTFRDYIDEHNLYSPSEFFVHVGDINAGSEACKEERYQDVAEIMKGLAVPGYILVGDNEWVCCSDPDKAWGWWWDNFQYFERNFCTPYTVEHQEVRPDNFAFVSKGVLFVGISIPAGSGGDGQEERLQDDADWVKAQFEDKKSQVRAAVVFGHSGPNSKRETFFNQFEPAAGDFGKPVLYMQGDGHKWKVNNPFSEPNMLRVQVARGGSDPPVQVTVTMDMSSTSSAFELLREPWKNADIYNMAPCAAAGPDQSIELNETVGLDGKVRDDGIPKSPGKVTTNWIKVSGPGNVSFGNTSDPTTTASFGQPGVYVLALTADDGELQGSDEATIYVDSKGASLTIDDVTINEGNSGSNAASFTVNLIGDSGGEVKVDFATENGTASEGSDYSGNSGTLTFSGGTTSRTINVNVIGDVVDEPDETFLVKLSNASNATIAKTQATGTITDDDLPALPEITSFDPASGPVGTEVTIVGNHFNGVTNVSFNDVVASVVAIDSDTQLRAVVPDAASPGPISLTFEGGSIDSDNDFDVTPPPAPIIAAFDPQEGSVGNNVTITGEYFIGATSVSFNGVEAVSFTVISNTEIKADVPEGTDSGVIRVTTPSGTGTSNGAFTVIIPPVVISPSADSYVRVSSPTNNYGTQNQLRVGDEYSTYMKFEVNNLEGSVLNATIRLRVREGGDDGGAIYAVSNYHKGVNTHWGENDLIWENAPEAHGAALSTLAHVGDEQWIDFDVTGAVPCNGTFSFILKSEAADYVRYSSKEGNYLPELILTLDDNPIPAPAITSFSPVSAAVGTEVTISGTNLIGATEVSFNGVAATEYHVDSNFQLRATIPADATTGKISVTTKGGTATSVDDFEITVPLPPAAPSNLTAEATGSTAIHLTWDDNSGDETNFKIERKTGGGDFTEIATVDANATEYNDSGLTENTTYTYRVRASNDIGYSGYTNEASATTLDGSLPTLSINDVTVDEGDGSTTSAEFEVTLSEASQQEVTVDYSTQDGNATEGDDYTAQNGTLTFPAGEITQTITIEVLGDTNFEPDETFIVSLSNASNAEINDGEGVGTITNDDLPPAPEVSSFNPTSGPLGTQVTISGNHFNNATGVSFNGTSVSNFTVENDNRIYAEVPAGATTGAVSVITPSGAGASADEFTVTEPSASSTTTFIVMADAFVRSTKSTNNYGTKSYLQVQNSSTIYQAYFKFDVANLNGGVQKATLRLHARNDNPDGGSVYSVSNNYKGTNTPWTEIELNWDNAPEPLGNPLDNVGVVVEDAWAEFDVTSAIHGSGHYSFVVVGNLEDRIRYGSRERDDEAAQLVIETSTAPTLSINDVTVTEGNSGTTIAEFTVNLNNPNGEQVTVDYATSNGTASEGTDYFSSSSTITFNGESSQTFSVLVVGDLLDEANETFFVNLSNPTNAVIAKGEGVGSITDDDLPPAPEVTGFNPTSAPYGTEVTISGFNFSNASAVLFSGVEAESFTIDNDNQIRATIPASAITGPIGVTNEGGTGISADAFTVIPPPGPAITSFTPTAGSAGTGVTIFGQYFTGATEVTFGGVPATSFIFVNDGEISVIVPAGALTGKIAATTPGGTGESADDFITTVEPLSFKPSDDSFARSTRPDINYNDKSYLQVRESSSTYYSFLKFNVTGITGTVQSATVKLYVRDEGIDGGSIYPVSNNYKGTATPWDEIGLTWANAPEVSSAPLSDVGAVVANEWVEFDVTNAINGDGTYSFALKNATDERVKYSTKERSWEEPELHIVMSSNASSLAKGSAQKGAAAIIPDEITLGQNYPNPFNPSTMISFSVPQKTRVTIQIYNIAGQEVETLVDAIHERGVYDITFDASKLSTGIYLSTMKAGGETKVRRMIFMK